MTSKSAPSARGTKYVYSFGGGTAEGDGSQKNLLGGKGANLAEMARIGLPVPPGFTISTEVCTYYYANGRTYPKGLEKVVDVHLAGVEKKLGKKFGDPKNPLLVSVRSGARASMPGMMDTILNLGLNDVTVEGLAKASGNPRFAWDCYRRFVAMYGDVVLDLKPVGKHERDPFEVILEAKKEKFGAHLDTELTVEALKELVGEFKKAIKDKTGHVFPEDPMAQLWGAIGAVFSSWMNERAIVYRQLNSIPESWGTAVNVQSMVFGNLGEDCGTGVAFTRDPATGENLFYGEYLINAQGEDVVAGIRTPQKIATLQQAMPKVYDQLMGIRQKLEKHYRDMQDIEFTVERGRLFMLQTRTAKRTGFAEVRIAVEMEREKLITAEEAILRVNPDSLNQLLRPVFDPAARNAAVAEGQLFAKGLNAGPGAATGRVVFSAQDAFEWAKRGEKVLLVREETSPEDIKGMNAAEGILTARGGMTSHAALVARQMGKVCIVGCESLRIDYAQRCMTVKGDAKNRVVMEGDWLSIDGSTGEVLEGRLATKPSEVLQVLLEKSLAPEASPVYTLYATMMGWADKVRRLRVRANADQPDQATNAVLFGAEGIGLCRTEHMFFGGDRITAVREMILGDSVEAREKALAKLLPMQRERLRGGLPGDGPAPRHDPDDRPAAPRVPAAHPRRAGGRRREARRLVGDRGPEGERAPRDEPDARPPRLPPRDRLPRDHADAGARHPRGGLHREEGRGRGEAGDHDPARRPRERAEGPGEGRPRDREGRLREGRHHGRLPRRDDDRAAARGADGRRDRHRRRVLQLRDERPDADDVRPQPRRRRQVPPRLRPPRDPPRRPVREDRPGRRRQAREDGRRAGPHDPAEAEDRHLRRARRRAVVGRVLPPDEPRLRQLLAVPDPDRPSRRRPGRRPRGGEGVRQGRRRRRRPRPRRPRRWPRSRLPRPLRRRSP